jgi:hypothetical protein
MIIIQPSASRTINPCAPIPSSKLLGYYHSSALRTENSTFRAKPVQALACAFICSLNAVVHYKLNSKLRVPSLRASPDSIPEGGASAP